MADIIVLDRSYTVSSDEDLLQYTAVGPTDDTDLSCSEPTAGSWILGVIQNGDGQLPPTTYGTVKKGQIAEVRVLGVTEMQVGGTAVDGGDPVMVDGEGLAVPWTATNYCIGFCERGGAVGALCSVVLMPIGYHA